MLDVLEDRAWATLGVARRRSADVATRAQAVADIARADADAVDRDGVFPHSAITAARRANLLGLLVPSEIGGEGATLSDVANVCCTLGQACASTAMIIAMHHAALGCLVRHSQASSWHIDLLRRVAAENLLLASSTTEGNAGGNVRNSVAPLERSNGKISLERAATVMSYGAEADGIVTTARRDAGGTVSDQSLVVFLKTDYSLAATGTWHTLGMRGTCSSGFALKAVGSVEQVLPVGYEKIHTQTMVPVSHLLWSSAWYGIAASAVTKAQNFVRSAARRTGGQMPPGAPQYTKAVAALLGLRGRLVAALAEYEAMADDYGLLGSLESQTELALLKVDVSEGALSTVLLAMRACGLAGYRNDGEFGIGRHLRDILSAPIMIHNERILDGVAKTALMSPVPTCLRDLYP